MKISKRVWTLLVWAIPVGVWGMVFATDDVALSGGGMVSLAVYVTVGALVGARLCHRWEATVALVAAFIIGLSPATQPELWLVSDAIHRLMVGAALWYLIGLAFGAGARAVWLRARRDRLPAC